MTFNKRHRPPRFPRWLLHRMKNYHEDYLIVGDFEETFYHIASLKGNGRADLWFWIQTVTCFFKYIVNRFYWRTVMYKNYLKIALRNIRKHKAYSFINIAGLAMGMACCIMIFLWVQDELSFDRFHENGDDIYRIVCDWDKNNWKGVEGTPGPLGPAIGSGIPEIIHPARVATHSSKVFKYGDKVFYEDRGIIADPALFKIFSFPFIEGNPETAFSKPSDIIITESFARKYFESENPISKTMQVDDQLATVKGVIEDIPQNSHIRFDFMSSFEFINDLSGWGTHWGAFNFSTYVLVREDANLEGVGQKITDIALKNECPQVKEGVTMRLQHLLKIHLDSRSYQINVYALGDSRLVYLFTVIAFFVLLIACVNFMNLSTARSVIRAKEVGMRKTVGARRNQLIKQFFGESILLALVACLFSIILVAFLLPSFKNLSGKQLTIDFSNSQFVFGLVAIVLLTGLISGSYPALFLSAFKPVSVLKSIIQTGKKGASFRRILVVIQFSLSILLIIGTTVIYRQLRYIRNKELGFDKENIVFIPIKENIATKYEIVKNELLQNPDIVSVTAQYSSLTSTWRNAGWIWEGADPERAEDLDLILAGVDFGFFETLNIPIIDGRSFSKTYTTDATMGSVILNESAIKEMGLESPVGKWFAASENQRATIVGVVKDVHFQSLHRKIHPRLFFIYDMSKATSYGIVLIKIKEGRIPQAVSTIRDIWEDINPISPFEYHFLDESYDHLYRNERRVGTVINYFTFLAIFISCLGLFGLASFMAERRTKEIGIRKVLGAPVSKIVVLLSIDFTRWVLIANIIALPIGYFVMKKLLQVYVYKIKLSPDIFILSGLSAVMIALLTVSLQAFRAARTNPVEALRYE